MSKDTNQNLVYMDIGLLRDHISKLREEKKVAHRLYETVVAMKTFADPAATCQYDPVLRDIEQMIEYFVRMADQLSQIEDEAGQLSHELKGLIKDSTDMTQNVTEESFAL